MAIRIRVYPQHNSPGARHNRAVARAEVKEQRRLATMQLKYERALWQQRLQNQQLSAAMQYGGGVPGAYMGASSYGGNAYGTSNWGLGALGSLGGLFNLPGMTPPPPPPAYGGYPSQGGYGYGSYGGQVPGYGASPYSRWSGGFGGVQQTPYGVGSTGW